MYTQHKLIPTHIIHSEEGEAEHLANVGHGCEILVAVGGNLLEMAHQFLQCTIVDRVRQLQGREQPAIFIDLLRSACHPRYKFNIQQVLVI